MMPCAILDAFAGSPSPSARHVLAVDVSGTVSVLEIQTAKCQVLTKCEQISRFMTAPRFVWEDDGSALSVVGKDDAVETFRIFPGLGANACATSAERFATPAALVTRDNSHFTAISPDTSRMVFNAWSGHNLYAYDFATERCHVISSVSACVKTPAVWAPDSDKLAVQVSPGTVAVRQASAHYAASFVCSLLLMKADHPTACMAWADNDVLGVLFADADLLLWSTATGHKRLIRKLLGAHSTMWSRDWFLAWCPSNPMLLAVGNPASDVYVFHRDNSNNSAAPRQAAILATHHGSVRKGIHDLRWSKTGHVVVAPTNKKVCVWDVFSVSAWMTRRHFLRNVVQASLAAAAAPAREENSFRDPRLCTSTNSTATSIHALGVALFL